MVLFLQEEAWRSDLAIDLFSLPSRLILLDSSCFVLKFRNGTGASDKVVSVGRTHLSKIEREFDHLTIQPWILYDASNHQVNLN